MAAWANTPWPGGWRSGIAGIMVDRGRAGWQGADVSQGIVRAVRAVEWSNCSGLLGMTKDGPPLRCSPIDAEQIPQDIYT